MRTAHDQSADLGGVVRHTTLDSRVSSPHKVNLTEWDQSDGEESESQKSTRALESKEKIQGRALSARQGCSSS